MLLLLFAAAVLWSLYDWLLPAFSPPPLTHRSHQPGSYTPSSATAYLAKHMQSLSAGPLSSYLAAQPCGLQNLSFWAAHLSENTPAVLHRYYRAFDAVIFSGSLEGRCVLEYIPVSDPRWADGDEDGLWGRTWFLRRGRCEIWMYEQEEEEGKEEEEKDKNEREERTEEKGASTRQRRLARYIGTLLHEMLHAFQHIYVCKCVTCSDGRRNGYAGLGFGHGRAWQVLAKEVEDFVREQLRTPVSLMRAASLGAEMALCGKKWTGLESGEWEELGLGRRKEVVERWRRFYAKRLEEGHRVLN